MKENALITLSRQFAVDIINLCSEIKENRKGNVLVNQLLRSGTSIGANIHEGNYASSRADFINKFQDTKFIAENEFNDIYSKCSKIRKLLTASITTAKGNSQKNDLPLA